MSELTLEDFISDLNDAKYRLDDAEGDVCNAEDDLKNFCDENDLEYPEGIE